VEQLMEISEGLKAAERALQPGGTLAGLARSH
jgi:hypothetical protein